MFMDLGFRPGVRGLIKNPIMRASVQSWRRWTILNLLSDDGEIIGIIVINNYNSYSKLINSWGSVFVEFIDKRSPRRFLIFDESQSSSIFYKFQSSDNDDDNANGVDRLIAFLSKFRK